jgi:hypothetical protein
MQVCLFFRAKSTVDYLESLGITQMDWPPQSPDQNPLENVFGILKREVYRKKSYNNLDDLWAAIEREFKRIPTKTITDLIDSVPRRIEALLKKRGGATKY